MTVIGTRKSSFDTKDTPSQRITGYNIYLTEPIDPKRGVGEACERIFLTEDKLNGFLPSIGDDIIVTYNKFGKPTAIELADAR